MNAKKILEEVWSYYDFHQEISKYFNEGINFEPKENKKGHFSFYYGKWCYQYKLEKFNLEDETKIF